MIIVADTTPLSELAKVGRMNLLRDLYETIIIPTEVYSELSSGSHPTVRAIESAT